MTKKVLAYSVGLGTSMAIGWINGTWSNRFIEIQTIRTVVANTRTRMHEAEKIDDKITPTLTALQGKSK